MESLGQVLRHPSGQVLKLRSCCERREDVHRQSCPQQVGVKAPTRALDTITNSGKCLLYVGFRLPRSQHPRIRSRHLQSRDIQGCA